MDSPAGGGTFTLHRFNGDEVYRISSAVMFVVEDKNETAPLDLWFEVNTTREAVQTLPDTVELGMHPYAEVLVNIDQLDLDALVGARFSVPEGCVEDEDSPRAFLYYCEHEPLDENEIQILERQGDLFRVHWTGTTTDVNYYDGSKPDTRVEIAGQFVFVRSAAEATALHSRT